MSANESGPILDQLSAENTPLYDVKKRIEYAIQKAGAEKRNTIRVSITHQQIKDKDVNAIAEQYTEEGYYVAIREDFIGVCRPLGGKIVLKRRIPFFSDEFFQRNVFWLKLLMC